MADEIGTEVVDSTVSTEMVEPADVPGPESAAGEIPAQQPTGINPAWEPLREAIGEDYFATHALPILKGMDESAHTRITYLNSQLKGFESFQPFVDQSVSADDLQMAMELRQLFETNPQGVYELLGQHLGLGQGTESEETLEELGQEEAVLPPHIQARIDQLEQFQQNFLLQAQQQQQQAQQAQAIEAEGQRLDQEMSDFLTKNPTFTESDKAELFRIQYELTMNLQQQGLNRMATLDEAAAILKDRFASYAQRFGGKVPSVLPTTTGGDIPGQTPNVAKMSKQDLVDLVANDLFAAKAQQS